MSKFNISKIEIENFRSIEKKVTLEIKPGLFSIEGINADEISANNGAGKTTLVSALYWCLTGSALTNEVLADEVVNARVGKDCRVSLYILLDNSEIKVTRTRKDTEFGNSLQLEMDGQNISCHKATDTQQRLNQLLKIPFTLLHSIIIMTSDMKSAFSELTPQQRVQTLESIRDYSVWDKVREEANKDIKLYNKEISDYNLKISNLQGSYSTYERLLNTSLENLKEIGQKNIDEKGISACIEDLNKQVLENKEKINKNEELSHVFQVKSDEEITLFSTNNLQDFTLFTTNKQSIKEELDKITEEANTIKLNIQKLNFEKDMKEREISIIDKWFTDDICPTCKRPLDRKQSEIEEKQKEKKDLQDKYTSIQTDITKLEQELTSKRTKWVEKNKEYQQEQVKEKEAEQKRILAIKNQDEEKNKIRRKYTDMINEVNKENVLLHKVINELENNIKSLTTLESYKKELEELSKQIKEIEENLEKVTYKRQLSDYFYKLLGSKGELRPFLLNKDIMYLNHCMQRYICRLFKNTDVKLVLSGSTIEIVIDSNGIKKNVSSLSGGEKKRLNLAIQLALYDLLKATSQIGFNVLWLDEVESQLDTLGIQQLIEIIEDKSNDIETIFWITNRDEVKSSIDKKIICKKTFGRTEVEFQ